MTYAADSLVVDSRLQSQAHVSVWSRLIQLSLGIGAGYRVKHPGSSRPGNMWRPRPRWHGIRHPLTTRSECRGLITPG